MSTSDEKIYTLLTYNKALLAVKKTKHAQITTSYEANKPVTEDNHLNDMFTLDLIIEFNERAINFLNALSQSKNKRATAALDTLLNRVNLSPELPHLFVKDTIDVLHQHAASDSKPFIDSRQFTSKLFLVVCAITSLAPIIHSAFYSSQEPEQSTLQIDLLLILPPALTFMLFLYIGESASHLKFASRDTNFEHSESCEEPFFKDYKFYSQKEEELSESKLTVSHIHNRAETFMTGKKHLLWDNFFNAELNNPLKEEVKKEYDALMQPS